MPFTKGGPFIGNNATPLIASPFVQTWSIDIPLPPPGNDFIITEDSLFYVASEGGDNLITEN